METLLINDKNGIEYLINVNNIATIRGFYNEHGKEECCSCIKLINGESVSVQEYFSALVKILHE